MLFSNFTALLKSSQLSAAHVSSSYVFPSLLSSPHIFYKSSSRTKLISALASSSHLISALPWSKTCSNYGSRRHFEQPLRLPRNPQRRFDTEKLLHTASFLTREACTHRSFHTEAGKLLHRDREAFTQSGKLLPAASFYTEQAFGCSKLLHGNLYIEKLLHAGSFYTQQTFTHTHTEAFFGTQKLLHEEAFTQRSYHTHTHTLAFSKRSPYTEKNLRAEVLHTASFHTHTPNFHTEKPLNREACPQLLHTAKQDFIQRGPYTQRSLHTKTSTERSF